MARSDTVAEIVLHKDLAVALEEWLRRISRFRLMKVAGKLDGLTTHSGIAPI
jgi:hypothetical protein